MTNDEPHVIESEDEFHDFVAAVMQVHDSMRPCENDSTSGIEPIVASTFMGYFGEVPYATLTEQVAGLAYKIAKDHAFMDGNKRTAVVFSLTVLERYGGYTLDVCSNELYRMIQELTCGEMGRDELVAWIYAHRVPAGPEGGVACPAEPCEGCRVVPTRQKP